MSTHGMLDECQEHKTWRKVDGPLRSFNYTEQFSWYSHAKHWVDDHNNQRHNPIGLEKSEQRNGAVAEVNACYLQARG